MTIYRIVEEATGLIVSSVDTTDALIKHYLKRGQVALQIGDELMINDAEIKVEGGVFVPLAPPILKEHNDAD